MQWDPPETPRRNTRIRQPAGLAAPDSGASQQSRSTSAEPSKTQKHRRWLIGAFVAGVLLLVVVVAAIAGTSEDDTSDTAVSAESATSQASATTTTSTTTTTTLPPPQVLSGLGDGVVDVDLAAYTLPIATFSHSGSSNFIVAAIGAANQRLEGLVNEIGTWDGTVPLLTNDVLGATRLEIEADGSWEVTIEDLLARPDKQFDAPGTVNGTRDDVFLIRGVPDTADISHDGGSNFIVRACSVLTGECDGYVNEIGFYEGTILLPRESLVFMVEADGNWTFAFATS